MNLDETKKYIDKRLSRLGWAVNLDNPGYLMIHQFSRGHENRLSQLYYKVVSIGSQQPKREVTNDVVEAAIDELVRMSDMLDKTIKKNRNNNEHILNNQQNDRLSIELLAKELEMGAASNLKIDHNKTTAGVAAKSRGNGAQEIAVKPGSGTALPTILVVDDSPTIRAVVNKSLANDFTIVQASDGDDAWDYLLANNDVELVVTDLMMPNLDGYGLIERIRSDKAPIYLAGIPIIVVTTLEDANAKLRALVCGANDFITKSTDAAELQARVLARYRLAQTLKDTEKQKTYNRRPNLNVPMPPSGAAHPTGNSASASARGVASSAKTHVASLAQANKQSSKPAAGGKPETAKPGVQHSAAHAKVTPTAGVHERYAVGKANQLEAMAAKPKSRHNPTVIVTLTATLLVLIIIFGITRLDQFEPPVAEPPSVVAQASESDSKTIDDDSQQQLLSEQETSSLLSKTGSTASQPEMSPMTAGSGVTDNAVGAAKEQSQSAMPGAIKSTVKETSSALDKSAPQAVSSSSPQKPKLPDVAANAVPGKSIVTTEKSAKPTATIEKSSAGKSASSAASTSLSKSNVSSPGPVKAETKDLKLGQAPSSGQKPAQSASVGDFSVTSPSDQQSSQQSAASVAESNTTVARSKVELAPVTIAPAIPIGHVSQAELAALIKRFIFVYEAGDINQFLTLFDQNVRTNDRSTKEGLREDYEGLFNTTDLRQMTLGNVAWELRDNKADGWGNFEVKVRKKGEGQIKAFTGSLTFHVVKNDGRLVIKQLYHGQRRVGGG
jgi:CheY-like chemotaxis protein